jgi:RimJ/RimL family protein N-acetyltransferase
MIRLQTTRERAMIPRLETERLLLREWRNEDFEPLAGFMADPDVTRWLNGEPLNRSDAWRGLTAIIGHWQLRGYGLWAVERKSDHAFIGRVGLNNPEGWPGLEIGWTLGKPYWGAGYASEAARTVMSYGFLTQPVEKLISVIHIDNKPSQAVAQRVGETKGERYDVLFGGKTYPTELWQISREDWMRRLAEKKPL